MSIGDLPNLDHYNDINEKFWKTSKKYDKLLHITYENLPNNIEIQELEWKLDEIYNFILAAILYLDEPTITSISETIQNFDNKSRISKTDKGNFYTLVERKIWYLEKYKIISIYSIEEKGNLKKPSPKFKLSLNGLCYYIINWDHNPFVSIGPEMILNKIFHKYYDSPILQDFLIPHFEVDTIKKANDDLSIEVLQYLSEICKIIVLIRRGMERDKDSLIDGKWPEQLFIWPSTDQEARHNFEEDLQRADNLRMLLLRELDWHWINKAKIEPNFENNIITIKSPVLNTNAFIKINKKEETVTVFCNNKKCLSLRMHIHTDGSISVYGRSTINEKELSQNLLTHLSNVRLFSLVLSIRTNYRGNSSQLLKLVANDKRFKATVKKLVNLIDLSPRR